MLWGDLAEVVNLVSGLRWSIRAASGRGSMRQIRRFDPLPSDGEMDEEKAVTEMPGALAPITEIK